MKVVLSIVLLTFLSLKTSAAMLVVDVQDQDNNGIENAVILVHAQTPITKPVHAKTAEMFQQDRQFSPFVMPVAVNTEVTFPNKDKVKHHVYSFSEAKSFELKLYNDFVGDPIQFNQTGVVELGCNIHDWMLAYIYVTDADFFAATTKSGQVQFELPTGSYTIQMWHPYAQENFLTQQLDVSDTQTLNLRFTPELDTSADFSSGFDDFYD